MSITAEVVRQLREETGAGMMDCKAALVESSGDMAKAREVLRKKGLAAAAKKASRTASDGAVGAHIAADGKSGVVVEVNCETDFVAKTPDFQALVKSIAEHIWKNDPADVKALLEQPFGPGHPTRDPRDSGPVPTPSNDLPAGDTNEPRAGDYRDARSRRA